MILLTARLADGIVPTPRTTTGSEGRKPDQTAGCARFQYAGQIGWRLSDLELESRTVVLYPDSFKRLPFQTVSQEHAVLSIVFRDSGLEFSKFRSHCRITACQPLDSQVLSLVICKSQVVG